MPSVVHSCLFHAGTSKEVEMISSHAISGAGSLVLRLYSNHSRHIKECQSCIYCLTFHNRIDRI